MISRPSQRDCLSRLLRGRTDQSSCPDAKSQKEKHAATSTCLGPKLNEHISVARISTGGCTRSGAASIKTHRNRVGLFSAGAAWNPGALRRDANEDSHDPV